MITSDDIKAAVTAAVGPKKQKFSRMEVFNLIEKVLRRAGLFAGQGQKTERPGMIGKFYQNMALISAEPDGYKVMPLCSGQELDLMIDGEWIRARVIDQDPSRGGTKQRFDLPDSLPVFGVFAKMPLVLDGSNLPRLDFNNEPQKLDEGAGKNGK